MRIGIIVPMITEARILFQMREFPVRRRIGIREIHEHIEGNHTLGMMISGIGMVNAAAATESLIAEWKPDVVALVGCAGGIVEDLLPGDVLIGRDLCSYTSYQTLKDGTVNLDGIAIRVGTDYSLNEDRLDFAFDGRSKQRHIQSTSSLVEAALAAGDSVRSAFHTWPIEVTASSNAPKFGLRAPKCRAGVIGTADQVNSDPKVITEIIERYGLDAEECEGSAFGQIALSHQKPFIVIRGISDNEVVDPFLGEWIRNNRAGLEAVEVESTRNAWLVFLEMIQNL